MNMPDENTNTPEPVIALSIDAAKLMLQIIDRLSKAGAISGDELLAVGYLYNDINGKVEIVEQGNT